MKKLIPLFFVALVLVFVGSGCESKSAGDTWTRDADEMVMVYVPAGNFEMGSTDAQVDDAIALCKEYAEECDLAWFEWQQPVHTVALDAFWIDRTEVTNTQFRVCVEAGECEAPTTCTFGQSTYGDPGKTEHPAVCVDWAGAKTYCEWAGARLPSEAEWEYAARGPDGLMFPWGDEFDGTLVNYCDVNCPDIEIADQAVDDGYELTSPAGSYPAGASWCGALDLAGNVWEWLSDWFGDYSSERQENPTGPATGQDRAVRGGGWRFRQDDLRGATRGLSAPDDAYPGVGFRCAKGAD